MGALRFVPWVICKWSEFSYVTAVKPSYEILTLHIVKTSLTKIKHLEWPNEKVEENGLAFFWPFWSSHILPWLCNPLRACTHVTPCVHGSITPQPMVQSEKFQKQTPIILPKLVQQQQVRPSTTLRACTHATPCVHGSITPQPMVRSEKFQKQTPIILPKLVQQQQVWPSTTLCACTHATPCVHGSITLF